MRGGGYLVILAGVTVLAAGCGTEVAQPVNLAAAVTRTAEGVRQDTRRGLRAVAAREVLDRCRCRDVR